MRNPLNIRRGIRSMLIITGVCVGAGTIYELIDTGTLTLAGPFIGLIVGMPLVLFEVFPLNLLRS